MHCIKVNINHGQKKTSVPSFKLIDLMVMEWPSWNVLDSVLCSPRPHIFFFFYLNLLLRRFYFFFCCCCCYCCRLRRRRPCFSSPTYFLWWSVHWIYRQWQYRLWKIEYMCDFMRSQCVTVFVYCHLDHHHSLESFKCHDGFLSTTKHFYANT